MSRAVAAGRMTPAGLAKVKQAKRDRSWFALDAVEALEVPPDLAPAFAAHPPAATNFEAFPRSVNRGILEWISNAKTVAARQKRVVATATLAGQNRRANQWRDR